MLGGWLQGAVLKKRQAACSGWLGCVLSVLVAGNYEATGCLVKSSATVAGTELRWCSIRELLPYPVARYPADPLLGSPTVGKLEPSTLKGSSRL